MSRSLAEISSYHKLLLILLAGLLLVLFFPSSAVSAGRGGEGERYLRLEKINITGAEEIKPQLIISTMKLQAGDTVTTKRLERERQRLLGIHYLIENLVFSTRPGKRRGYVIVDIMVEERESLSLETGYGYHDVHGWFLTLLGLRVEPALGYHSHLNIGVRLGFRLSGVDARWKREPPPDGGFGVAAGVHAYNQERLFFGSGPSGEGETGWEGEGWREFEQKINRAGGEISLRYSTGGPEKFALGIRAESVTPDSSFMDVEPDRQRFYRELPPSLKTGTEKTLITGVFFRLIRDTRSHVIYPEGGSLIKLSIRAHNTALGGDELFSKVTMDFRKHVGLGNGRVLSGRLSCGAVSRGAPFFERFSLGGIYSIRGFRELSLSPPVGHDGCWLACGELRFPLIPSKEEPPRLSGLVFLDAGQGWLRGRPLSLSGVESAGGYGFRLRLPWLGTLGVDVGIPLSKGNTGDPFYIHGALGFSF